MTAEHAALASTALPTTRRRLAWDGSPAILAPVLAGGALVAMLVALSLLDPSRAAIWPEIELTVVGMAALATLVQGTRLAATQIDRWVRAAVAVAAVFYLIGQLDRLAELLGGVELGTALDAIPVVGLLLAISSCWWFVLRGRFSAIDQVAINLDSAAVFFAATAAVLLALGGQVHDTDSAMLLAYTIVFAGAFGATLVLNLATTPRRFLGGWLVILAGIPFVAIGFAWRLSALHDAWQPYGPVASFGLLLAAYGVATWTAELDPSVRFRGLARRIRAAVPLAAVGVAPVIIVLNQLFISRNGGSVGLAVDSSLAVVLIILLVRQTIILRQRDRIAEEAHQSAGRERALREEMSISEQRFRTLVSNSSDVFLIMSSDGTVTYQSPAIERVLGYPQDERVGRQIFELTHPDDIGFVQTVIRELMLSPNAQRTVELRSRHADGSWRTLEATARNMVMDPAIGGVVVNYRDITERKILESQLIHQAFHDPLTGLANRALFIDRVSHALRRRGDTTGIAVLFMDLDDFKTVNDSLGHGAGDQVLMAVSERLLACVRPEDTVSRLGGDEFAVLIEDGPTTTAGDVAERFIAALRTPFEVAGKQAHLSASIGIAFNGGEVRSADDILRNADVAMYTAKGRGKGRVETFELSMHAAVVARLELRADLEHALERGEFRLRYQPVFAIAGGGLHSFETLLRWRHPQRGEVLPNDFVPLAEETGLIVPIGRWVLEKACEQAKAWVDGGRPELRVSVNVSSRQLREAEFVAWVAEALTRSGLDPDRLILELTESGIMQDDEGRLHALRAMGVHLALDDFGTGYSSLSHLARFPIEILKIDHSFTAQLGTDGEDSALIRSVIQLASAMELTTVAEGIERQDQLDRLKEMGCTYAQGYLLARPMDAIRATALVNSAPSMSQASAS
jgi:diguanylate cyclase (GGDEF)-like protein/PAS domain S-box-containing protein